MKIKIEKKYKEKVKLFKSNVYLKKIFNDDIKNVYKNKQITLYESLKKIPGINSSSAYNFLISSGVSPKTSLNNIKKNISAINKNFENNLSTNDLILNQNVLWDRRKNVQKKINIMNLSGTRHKNNLPVRGQRTSTNARTRKKFRII